MLTTQQESSLTSGGDCFEHWHSQDRVLSHNSLLQLQQLQNVATVSTNTTLSDINDIVLVDTTGGNVTVNLPPARNGRVYTVVKLSTTNLLTVAASGTDTIDSAASISTTTGWVSRTFKAVTGGWIIVAGYIFNEFPNGSFYDTTTQTAASTTTAYTISFSNTDSATGTSLVSGTKLYGSTAGVYNLQFSAQLLNSDAAVQEISVWLRKNGNNVANTNTEITIPSKHGLVDGRAVAAWNFFVRLNVGDYVELCWSASHTGVSLGYVGAQTNPTRPATPSIIATINFVSA